MDIEEFMESLGAVATGPYDYPKDTQEYLERTLKKMVECSPGSITDAHIKRLLQYYEDGAPWQKMSAAFIFKCLCEHNEVILLVPYIGQFVRLCLRNTIHYTQGAELLLKMAANGQATAIAPYKNYLERILNIETDRDDNILIHARYFTRLTIILIEACEKKTYQTTPRGPCPLTALQL